MSQDQKREAIIEAALKRFAHFGVAKTTMTEIGNDLAISKASLYYYFPDKINLYAAFLKTIIEKRKQKLCFSRIQIFLRQPLYYKHLHINTECYINVTYSTTPKNINFYIIFNDKSFVIIYLPY